MRRPQRTTRRLMVIIAVFGTFVGGYLFVSRSIAFRLELAATHWRELGLALHEAEFDNYVFGNCPRCGMELDGLAPSAEIKRPPRTFETAPPNPKNDYHDEMMHKWLRGATHPWLPVAPDPPEPK